MYFYYFQKSLHDPTYIEAAPFFTLHNIYPLSQHPNHLLSDLANAKPRPLSENEFLNGRDGAHMIMERDYQDQGRAETAPVMAGLGREVREGTRRQRGRNRGEEFERQQW